MPSTLQTLLLLSSLALSSASGPSGTPGGSIPTCSLQSSCIKLTFSQQSVSGSTVCKSGSCQWTACLELDTNANGCAKAGGTISHSCVKGQQCYSSSSANTFELTAASGNTYSDAPGDGFKQCQTGLPGSNLYFLLKDGVGCNSSIPAVYTSSVPISGASSSDTVVSCQPRPSYITSCTGNGVGVECIWTVKLPSCGPSNSGTSCNEIESHVPANYLTYESGFGPSCSLDDAMGVLGNCCGCNRPSADCQFVVCDNPIPPSKMNDLKNMQCWKK